MNVVFPGISEHVQYTATKLTKIKVPNKGLTAPMYRLTMLRASGKKVAAGGKKYQKNKTKAITEKGYKFLM